MSSGQIVQLLVQLFLVLCAIVAIVKIAIYVYERITGQEQELNNSNNYDNTLSYNNYDNASSYNNDDYSSSAPVINPASGLTMCGGIDTAGNVYGISSTVNLTLKPPFFKFN